MESGVFGAFTRSLAHRGPDGEGIEHFAAERLWLGHRRLAIHDRSARDRQPLSYGEGRYWLSYNGEIYNDAELRAELRGLGHGFATASDAEVILAAYAQWGPACLLRFNGMWAFALWDARERRLFLARDRFGLKPLHYSVRDGAISFASELKAFLALPWVDGALDPEILAEALTDIDGQGAASCTLLPGVERLQAGRSMTVEADGRIAVECWWNTLDHLPRPPADLQAQAEEFRALFLDSCRLRLRSDVPVATALSGGLDSSAIACCLAALGRQGAIAGAPSDWRRAFVARFAGTDYGDEAFARMVIAETGLTPVYHEVDDRTALAHVEQVIFTHEIICRFARVGAVSIYRAMRDAGIRVSLDGEGSDSLLGSSPEYLEAAFKEAAAHLDLRRYWELRRILGGIAGGNISIDRDTVMGEIRWLARRELARFNLLEPLRGFRARLRMLQRRGLAAALEPPASPAKGPILRAYAGPRRLRDAVIDARAAGMSALKARYYTNYHAYNLPTDLGNFDRASMAHGIESRMPFMDWRLVTYVFALPETARNSAGYTKRILRLAMEGLMPEPVRLRRTKVGFISPSDRWARGALGPWLRDQCASRSFLESTVWNGAAARAAVERAVAGAASIAPVWPIINAHALEEGFKARAAAHKSAIAASAGPSATPLRR
jgi:asparagine synthase (glutamine-hydrolysing)